jgi:hypothetical protein
MGVLLKRFRTRAWRHGYTYVAIVDRDTGTLRCLEAGCRHWTTFEDAFKHYAVSGEGYSKWRTHPKVWSAWTATRSKAIKHEKHRVSALKALAKLQSRVQRYQVKMRFDFVSRAQA